MWLMDDDKPVWVGAVGPFNPGPNWEIKATGDFNGDGRSDILWQGGDGTPAVWMMDGTRRLVRRRRSVQSGPNWESRAPATSATAGRYFMAGQRRHAGNLADGWQPSRLGRCRGLVQPRTELGVKGTGDFNGDGRSDILWQGSDGAGNLADGRPERD
jgi:hypothetical protein